MRILNENPRWARLVFDVGFVVLLQGFNLYAACVFYVIGYIAIVLILAQPMVQFFWPYAAAWTINVLTIDIARVSRKYPAIPPPHLARLAAIHAALGITLLLLLVWKGI